MKSHTTPLILIAGSILFLAAVLLMKPIDTAFGGAFTGSAAFLQYSTTTTAGPQGAAVQKNTLFAENQSCKSRTVTAPGTSAIMIAFDGIPAAGNVSSTSVSATVGHLQAASTTVTYDAEQYGCSQWHVWAWATTTLTVSEF